MASVTLTKLLARVRERCDMVGSSFVADSADGLYAFINDANAKLHGMLVEALGEEYVSSSSTLTTVSGTADYAVPSGFYKLYGVDLPINGYQLALKPYVQAERNVYRNVIGLSQSVPRYKLVGSNVRIYPTPSYVAVGAILYAPEATVLTAGSDTVNYPNGWERFIVLDAAIQVLLKEESSVTGLVAERDLVVKEIELAKEQRDLSGAHRVVEVDMVELFEDGQW